MRTSKSLAALAVAATVMASGQAHAFAVSFGGNDAMQSDVDTGASVRAGKTSAVAGYIDANTNTVIGANVFLETFDGTAGGSSLFGSSRPTGSNASEVHFPQGNGGFTTINPNAPADGGVLTITNATGPGMGIRKGTTSYAAAPGGDCAQAGSTNSCDATYFAYGPGQGGSLPSEVGINYFGLLNLYNTTFGGSHFVDYLGIYYGSVDTYNELRFYDEAGALINGSGQLNDGILSGTEILSAMGCTSVGSCTGNQTDPSSNTYINLAFAPGDRFSSFSFYTTGVAFEMDNVVIHLGQVPEPASLALVALGLLGLGSLRRKQM